MNWISNVVRPKIRGMLRREVPENLWIKCPETGQLVFYKDVEANQFVIPGSNYHMRMSANARLKSMFDNETWFDIAVPEVPVDPLKFRDERRYIDRLKDARSKTGLNDAMKLGYGKLDGLAVVLGVQDFDLWAARSAWRQAKRSSGSRHRGPEGLPVRAVRGLGRRAHARGHSFPDANAAHHHRRAEPARDAQPYIVVLTNPTTAASPPLMQCSATCTSPSPAR